MFSWVSQDIIVVQIYFHENVDFRESSVQYEFGKGKNYPLMGDINILFGMLMHRLSLNSLSVGLLRAWIAWHGSTFRVFVLCTGLTIMLVIP